MSWKNHVYPTQHIYLMHVDSSALQSIRETTIGALENVDTLIRILSLAGAMHGSQVSLKRHDKNGMYVLVPDGLSPVITSVCLCGIVYGVQVEVTAESFSLTLNDVYFMASRDYVGPFDEDVYQCPNGMFLLYDRIAMQTNVANGPTTVVAQNDRQGDNTKTMEKKWKQGKDHIKGLESRLLKLERELEASKQRANDLTAQKAEWKQGRDRLKRVQQQLHDLETEHSTFHATCSRQKKELQKAENQLKDMSETIQFHVENASILKAKFQDVLAMNKENVLRKKRETQGEKYFEAFHALALRVKDPSKLKRLGQDLLMLFEALQQGNSKPLEILTTAESLLNYIQAKPTTLGPLAYVKQLEKKHANLKRVNRLLLDKMKSKE